LVNPVAGANYTDFHMNVYDWNAESERDGISGKLHCYATVL